MVDIVKSELLHIDQVAEAVADAILVTQSRQLFTYAEREGGLENLDLEQVLGKSSGGMCGKASVDSIYFLSKKYPNLFKKMAVLGTYSVNSYVNSGSTPLRRTAWDHHAYFLVQDNFGKWYAGSPANYTSEEADYVKPFSSTNLRDIMAKIQERDGGVWPSTEFVEHAFDNYSPPLIRQNDSGKDVLEYLLIEKLYKDDRVMPSESTIEIPL